MAKGDLTAKHIVQYEAALDALTYTHLDNCDVCGIGATKEGVQTCTGRYGQAYRFFHKHLVELQLKWHRYAAKKEVPNEQK